MNPIQLLDALGNGEVDDLLDEICGGWDLLPAALLLCRKSVLESELRTNLTDFKRGRVGDEKHDSSIREGTVVEGEKWWLKKQITVAGLWGVRG